MSQENITASQEVVAKKPPDLELSKEFVKKLEDKVRVSASEVQSYVDRGVDLEYRINYYSNSTALTLASKHGFDETVRQLVACGAQLETTNSVGYTPLTRASYEGHESVVEFLLEQDANINHQDDDGDTALMLATKNKHESIVRLLLTHGADTSLVDRGGRTAWDWAEDGSSIQLLIALYSEDKTLDVDQCNQLLNSALVHFDVV